MADTLIHGHALFRAQYFHAREFLKQLATEKQKPKALYIGCCDSRVVPELLTSADPGQLFVVRNIANFVPDQHHSDHSVGAAIEYAVGVLQVPDLIVCGHTRCGGVQATIDGLAALPSGDLKHWLQGVEPAVKLAQKSGLQGQALTRKAVEENVLQALENLITFDVVKQRLDAGTLHLHGWVYDLDDGHVHVFDPEADRFNDALTF